jgi:hypothetical protein
MIEGRYFNGRDLTEEELQTMLRIISEVNVEAIIEDGQIVIQAAGPDNTIYSLARCDLIRLAAYSADVLKQTEGENGVYALAGLFAKCAQVILNETEPYYQKQEGEADLGTTVRWFAGEDTENPDEEDQEIEEVEETEP